MTIQTSTKEGQFSANDALSILMGQSEFPQENNIPSSNNPKPEKVKTKRKPAPKSTNATKKQEKPAQPSKPEQESSPTFQVVDYSEKAIAVFGDTKSIKDALYDAGGRFNRFLKKDGKPTPGWIFSKKKRDAVMKLVS